MFSLVMVMVGYVMGFVHADSSPTFYTFKSNLYNKTMSDNTTREVVGSYWNGGPSGDMCVDFISYLLHFLILIDSIYIHIFFLFFLFSIAAGTVVRTVRTIMGTSYNVI